MSKKGVFIERTIIAFSLSIITDREKQQIKMKGKNTLGN